MDLSTYLMLRVSSDSKDARADGESSMLMMSVSPIPVVGGSVVVSCVLAHSDACLWF